MPPMLNRAASRNGSCCGAPPGIDCVDYSKSKHPQRRIEKRQWRREQEHEDDAPDVGEKSVNIRSLDAGQWSPRP